MTLRNRIFWRGTLILSIALFSSVSAWADTANGGPYTPDADTLFLFHSDKNVSSQYEAYYGVDQQAPNYVFAGSPAQTSGPTPAFGPAVNFTGGETLIGDNYWWNFGNITPHLQQMTFETWVKVADSQIDTQAEHNGAHDSCILRSWQEFEVFTNAQGGVTIGYFQTALDNSGTNAVYLNSSEDVIWDGDWHYVALTVDHLTGDMQLYIDGQADTSGSVTVGDQLRNMNAQGYTSNIRIGQYDYNRLFIGDVDEVRLSQGIRTVVPEPMTMALMLAGGASLLLRRRK